MLATSWLLRSNFFTPSGTLACTRGHLSLSEQHDDYYKIMVSIFKNIVSLFVTVSAISVKNAPCACPGGSNCRDLCFYTRFLRSVVIFQS